MNGIEAISIERKEQLMKHKRSIIDDIKNNPKGQLSSAARKLISNSEQLADYPPEGWDPKKWAYMCSKPYKERIVIAGALCAAEYDRLVNSETNATEK